ncbi:hypothetical protein J6590_002746 [Homalodisca vitripennis]|nr:hypothetical protein J6590_002746 [Homalodisca vitripennis]
MPHVRRPIKKTKKGPTPTQAVSPQEKDNGSSGTLNLKQSNQQRMDSNTKIERTLEHGKSNNSSGDTNGDQLPKFKSGLLEKEIKLLSKKRNLQKTGGDNSNVTKEDEKTSQPLAKEVNKSDDGHKMNSNSVVDELVKCLTAFVKVLCAYLCEMIQHIVHNCSCCNDS